MESQLKLISMKYFIRNDIDSQMEHIKEKLGKIHPSHWKCSLHSTQSEDKDNNEDSPGVVTTCFLSLESPSDFVSTSLDAEKTKEYICEVYCELCPHDMTFVNVQIDTKYAKVCPIMI